MKQNVSTHHKGVSIFGVMLGTAAGVAGLLAAAACAIRHRDAIKRLIEISKM